MRANRNTRRAAVFLLAATVLMGLGCHSMSTYARADGHQPSKSEYEAAIEYCRAKAQEQIPSFSVSSTVWFVAIKRSAQRRGLYSDCMQANGWLPSDSRPTFAPESAESLPPPANPSGVAPLPPEAPPQTGDWQEVVAPDGTRILYNPATRESVLVPGQDE